MRLVLSNLGSGAVLVCAGMLTFMALSAGFYPGWLGAREPMQLDGYAALVNDRVITVGDVMAAMQPLERQLRSDSLAGPELQTRLKAAYSNTLESLIERELVLHEFERLKGTLPETAVKSRMREIERTHFNNNRAALLQALDDEGLTLDEWRASLRNTMIVAYMREREVENRVAVTPQAVRDAYLADRQKYLLPAKVELRMIVLNRGTTDEELDIKRRHADDVLRRLREGQSFEDLAKRFSEGTRAAEGGYWGWVDPSTRREELARAMQGLDAGSVSEVIEVEDLFYILKIEGRRDAARVPFDEVQDEIREDLRRARVRELYDEWIQRLKRHAYIRRF